MLIPSELHYNVSTPSYELWWHHLRVISLLMWSVKWVQSIECEDDGCFIYILLFLAWWQIFLLFLSLCPMVFRTSPRPFWGHFNILGVLGYCSLLVLMMSCLYFSKDLLLVLSEVYSSNIGLLLLVPILGFSSSHGRFFKG